jgi:acyl carrier protein
MNEIRKTIRTKVTELAQQLGHDTRDLRDDQEIQVGGLLDSASLMELILWFEAEFELEVDQDQLTPENFGTIDRMAAYAEKARA